jgi:hypothetical protein
MRFTDQRFRPELEPTIGVDSSTRIVDIDGKRTKLRIWDTVLACTHTLSLFFLKKKTSLLLPATNQLTYNAIISNVCSCYYYYLFVFTGWHGIVQVF